MNEELVNQVLKEKITIKNPENVEAFENEDPTIARKVFKKDKLINKINTDAHQIIINNIDKYDNNMLLYLLSSIRKIERAGDTLKKIREEIIYHLEAKVIKHSEKKNNL